MKCALRATIWMVVSSAAGSGCSAIAGFDDFHRECPAGRVLGREKGLPACVPEGGIDVPGSGGRAANGVAGHAGVAEGDGGDASAAGGASGANDAGTAGRASGGSSAGDTGGSAGTGETGGSAGSSGAGGATVVPSCPGTGGRFHGPAMAKVTRAGGSAFLIDRTEITFGDYDEFLAAHSPPPMDSTCSGPSMPLNPPCAALLAQEDAGGIDPTLPRVCVDWCDAEAYCRWAGKELCPDTASTSPTEREKSDFYLACSLGGTRYGCSAGCSAADCNGADSSSSAAVPVGTMTTCAVGDDACPIYDLSGNVEEWTNAAQRNIPEGPCTVRGGSFQSSETDLRCATQHLVARRDKFVTTGFRCCVDPAE